LWSRVVGVGQPRSCPPEPLPDVGRADARSAEIDSSEGVALSFHFSVYKVEPAKAVLACNLLANDDCRAALADEPAELRPEVAVVGGSAASAGGGERLARTGAGPDLAIVGPAGEPKGMRPYPDSGKEMRLRVTANVVWLDHRNGPFIDITLCYVPMLY